jgi:hypothetical protein
MTDTIKRPWRSILRIHPAAELFPQLSEDELWTLGEDIRKHGLQNLITLWVPADYHPVCGAKDFAQVYLLDGRNRLDACEAVGLAVIEDGQLAEFVRYEYRFEQGDYRRSDPYEFVISANLHRRHLTAEHRQKLCEDYIRLHASQSDRAIAADLKVSQPTISADRKRIAATDKDLSVEPRKGRDGKTRRAPRTKAARPGGRVGRIVEAAREAAKRAGVSLDEYVQTIPDPGEAKAALAAPHVKGAQPPDNSPANLISPDEIKAKLGPLVDELLDEIPALGALSKARRRARQIQRQIAQWTNPEPTQSAAGGSASVH